MFNLLPSEPVSMNFLSSFSSSFHLFTFLNHFSKHVELFSVKSPRYKTVVNAFTSYIINFVHPEDFMTDLGSQFSSQVYNNVIQSLEISVIPSSSGHPQTRGSYQRINTSTKSTIITLDREIHNFKQALIIHKNLYNATHAFLYRLFISISSEWLILIQYL